MKRSQWIAVVAGVVILGGCAANKRQLLADRCVARVQPLMKFVALVSPVPEADRKVCGCIAEKVDIDRAEAILAKSGDDRQNAMSEFLIENMPMMLRCARETGVVK